MRRMIIALVVALVGLSLTVYAEEKDTPSANYLRTKKLKGIISLDVKDQQLAEIVKDISEQLESQTLGTLSVKYGTGVSRNQRLTIKIEKKTLEETLDVLLGNDLGYVVISTEDPALKRYDGWIEIRTGKERGYSADSEKAKGVKGKAIVKADPKAEMKKEEMKKEEMKKEVVKVEPKEEPKEPAGLTPEEIKKEKLELAATTFFDLAQTYLDSNKTDKAKAKLQEIIKLFPMTDVAEEAKRLLDEIK